MQSNGLFFDNRTLVRACDGECCEFRIMHQKNVWSPYKGETLIAQPDSQDEAQENDKYAVGIYKKNDDGAKELVGHAPVDFLSLLYHFLQVSAENCINVEVIGKRKREAGLVVPAKCNAFTRTKRYQWYWMKNLLSEKDLTNPV